MATARRLGILLDECMGVRIAPVLRELRAPGAPHIHSSTELGLRGVSDEVLFGELHRRDFAAMVTKDSAILSASLRRDAWRATELHLFVMHGACGNLTLFEQMRCLIWWWPAIARQAQQDRPGTAWVVTSHLSGELKRRL